MLFFWNKWNKWNKACKSLILKTLFCSVAQNISRTISGFPLVDWVGKDNYALTQSITKTKGQSAEVARCPKWLVRRLQPVPSKKLKTKKSPACDWGLKVLPLELLNKFTDINKNAFCFLSVSDFKISVSILNQLFKLLTVYIATIQPTKIIHNSKILIGFNIVVQCRLVFIIPAVCWYKY